MARLKCPECGGTKEHKAVYACNECRKVGVSIRKTYAPIDKGFYRELEFRTSDIHVLPYDERDELRFLYEMMDVALIGKDTQWAQELYNQIKTIEGANTL
jgi:hypothetical protein